MREVSPVISRQTTMWKTWVGFNASHSMGAILFGLIYGYLALFHSALLFQSTFLLSVGFLMLGGLAMLGKMYWFSVPYRGICVSFACYVAAIVLATSLIPRYGINCSKPAAVNLAAFSTRAKYASNSRAAA